jgi:hypothetical protein
MFGTSRAVPSQVQGVERRQQPGRHQPSCWSVLPPPRAPAPHASCADEFSAAAQALPSNSGSGSVAKIKLEPLFGVILSTGNAIFARAREKELRGWLQGNGGGGAVMPLRAKKGESGGGSGAEH